MEKLSFYSENSRSRVKTSISFLGRCGKFLLPLLLVVVGSPVNPAIIGADGGVTLWISYDNLDSPGTGIDANVTQVDSTAAANCTPTNDARDAQGEPDSPGSCPAAGGDTCSGRDKLLGDIGNLAEYIYQSTHGSHYLRRVYVADQGRAWDTADIRWNVGGGGSTGAVGGWKSPGSHLNLNSSNRRCIHDVVHHELGHYFYELPDRYATSPRRPNYYQGTIDGGPVFTVTVDEGDPNTVMASNFPHRFVDTTNARLEVSYDQPGPGTTSNEVLTPALLTDADPDNDGPDRAHHGFTTPFAQDEWSVLPSAHVDLSGIHTEGDFSLPGVASMPAADVRFIGVDEPFPGTVLLLDRSGSMSVQTNGIPASQYVQEAGLYLYHSSEDEDYVGAFLYNQAVEKLFDYDLYDPTNQLPTASFRSASGLTNIALALEEAIDAMIAEHGADGVNSGQIVLMSDGKQTTGDSLWDQVDRANDLGIKIHTMSFGDADATTMDQIADNSGGGATLMSELDSGAELKLNMARKLTTLRGNRPIYTYKGGVAVSGEHERGEYFASEFSVPPRTRDVLFYVFLDRNNAADLDIELTDSAGQVIGVNALNLARKGRFNGIRVKGAKPGIWKYRITAGKRLKGKLPTNDNIEIVAFADNLELQARAWFDDAKKADADRRMLKARLDFRYPLTNMVVRALVYDGAKHIGTVNMYDNGHHGGDDDAGDGVYSAVVDLKSLKVSGDVQRKHPKKIRVDVEFFVSRETLPAPNAHYETGSDYDALVKDYRKLDVKQFTAYATLMMHWAPPDRQAPSLRVVYPRKAAMVKPGDKGVIRVKISDGRPSLGQVRVSLGQGIYARATSVKSDADGVGATVKIVYKVQKNAGPGVRTLSLQFGGTRLDKANAITVKGAGKIIKPPVKTQVKDLPLQQKTGKGVEAPR